MVGAHEAPRQRTFANATRSNKNDQQWLSGQELETARRVAWDRAHEFDESSR
jgi:hypothetical protein